MGPDPGKVLVDRLGLGTLILLLITLGMTPLQKLTGWAGWIAVRRQLGLWCFAYVVLHLSCVSAYSSLGLIGRSWESSCASGRTLLSVRLGFLGLLALAVTSNRYSQRRLGSSLEEAASPGVCDSWAWFAAHVVDRSRRSEGVGDLCIYRRAAISAAYPASVRANPPFNGEKSTFCDKSVIKG